MTIPDLAAIHPQVVHFALALLAVGVLFRWLHMTGRATFAGPAAAALILLGTAAAVVAVRSGEDAHSPVEQVPNVREPVKDHEVWGVRTRNIFLGVSGLEILGLALRRRRTARPVLLISGLVGTIGLVTLYRAGETGGSLVYSYAGGVGIRHGQQADVERLLLAGLYHQAHLDRANGRREDAAILFQEAARRFPEDQVIQLLAAESLLVDRRDPEAALAALRALPLRKEFLRIRSALLAADALEAAGRPAEARVALEQASAEYPHSQELRQRLDGVARASH